MFAIPHSSLLFKKLAIQAFFHPIVQSAHHSLFQSVHGVADKTSTVLLQFQTNDFSFKIFRIGVKELPFLSHKKIPSQVDS